MQELPKKKVLTYNTNKAFNCNPLNNTVLYGSSNF